MKKMISWNVNGIRACLDKGFLDFAKLIDADIFCIQESKMQEGQAVVDLPGYHQYWNSAEKKGYSGVAMFTKEEPISVAYGLGIEEHDHEGRVITAEFEDYYVEFSEKTSVQRQLLSDSDRFMAGKSIPYALQDGTKLPLRHDLFNHDAVILSNTSRYATIKSDKESRRVCMNFEDFKYLGIWHPGDTDAPFVCLEPWGALPATDGIIDNLETKADMTHVPPQKTAQVSYTVEIYE